MYIDNKVKWLCICCSFGGVYVIKRLSRRVNHLGLLTNKVSLLSVATCNCKWWMRNLNKRVNHVCLDDYFAYVLSETD